MKKLILAAALCAATVAAQAAPIQYNFAYDTGIGVLSGSLMGELQADQNTIVISSMLDFVKFDGVVGPSLPFTFSIRSFFSGNLIAARTTLDGSMQDIYALDRSGLGLRSTDEYDGFALVAALTDGSISLYGGGPSFGDTGEVPLTYVAANWSIHSAAAGPELTGVVPEPASLLLTGLALVGLAASRRRVAA